MTDLEMTRLCAEAMGVTVQFIDPQVFKWAGRSHYRIPELSESPNTEYNPLNDDAQAMALVKKMKLWIQPPNQGPLNFGKTHWFVAHNMKGGDSRNDDLNRAIVECVAKMQAAPLPVTCAATEEPA